MKTEKILTYIGAILNLVAAIIQFYIGYSSNQIHIPLLSMVDILLVVFGTIILIYANDFWN